MGRIKIKKERDHRKAFIILYVNSFKNYLIVYNHFNKYSLLGTNLVHFNIWSQVLVLKNNKAHMIRWRT